MLIGILSDSHGDVRAVREALAVLDRCGVEYTIHCGDVGGDSVFDEFIGRPFTFVWGNMDDAKQPSQVYVQAIGLPVPRHVPTLLELGGKRFAVFHGHERSFGRAPEILDVDYILHGHTHVARDERINGTRIINPGALYRARRKTIATLDTAKDHLVYYEITV